MIISRPSRDWTYLEIAKVVSLRGTCVRRQVGCVLTDEDGFILSTGYNGVASGRIHCAGGEPCKGVGAPSGQNLDQCQSIHAEQNAILRLSDHRKVHTVYCTASPCISCIKLLLGTSAKRVVFLEAYPHSDARTWWEGAGRSWEHFKP